jgi:hypothetical protein
MTVQRWTMIVSRNPTIVHRVETIVPPHRLYKLLRRVDRDGRPVDPNARSGEAIACSANRTLRSQRSGHVGKTICTRDCEPSGAIRGSDAFGEESLPAMKASDVPNARSRAQSDSFAATVTPIAALGEAKRRDGTTHCAERNDHRVARESNRTAREWNRTARELNRSARGLNCTARGIDAISW